MGALAGGGANGSVFTKPWFFVAPKVAAEVVGDWVVLEEPPVLGVVYQQPKVVGLTP